jgi:PKD repeat protein
MYRQEENTVAGFKRILKPSVTLSTRASGDGVQRKLFSDLSKRRERWYSEALVSWWKSGYTFYTQGGIVMDCNSFRNLPVRHAGHYGTRGIRLLVGGVLLLICAAAQAFPNYLAFWRTTYPDSLSDEHAGADGCLLCHRSETANSAWNAYGHALKQLVDVGFSVTLSFTLVEGNDSDQDPEQSDNISEIIANTQPGWTAGAVNPIYDRTGTVIATISPPTTVQLPYDPVTGPQPPVADPGGPYVASVGEAVQFDGSGSSDPDTETLVAYDWDFGDGNMGIGVNPVNIYATDGTYTVTLTVTDDSGLISAPATTTATINAVVSLDSDNDGVDDTLDNCIDSPNGPLIPDAGGFSQRDTDGDGYGNVCDADLNGDASVNFTDYSLFRNVFGQPGSSDADFNGDGAVNFTDYSLFRSAFGGVPGPSCCAP